MAHAEVSRTWDNLWRQNPSFRPVNPEHDTIGILSKTLLDSLPHTQLTFLDIGSGPASRTIPIIGGSDNIQLILLDQSRKALEMAAKHAEEQGIKAHYVQADGFQLPFRDGSISCVFANGVNEHFLDPLRQDFITEMVRATAPEGTTAIMVPNKLNPFHTLNKKIRDQRGTWPFGPQFDFTPKELKERMQQAGLVDVELFGVGAFTSWIRMLPKNLQGERYISPTPSQLLNEALWRLDANTGSIINRYLGREILAVARKPSRS